MAAGEHRRYEEELAAYLLGALTAPEVEQYRAHLEGCASCQAEERWLRAAVELLPSSVEQIEPPPSLRKRLMDTVRADAAGETRPHSQPSAVRRWRALLLRPATALATVAVVVAALAGYLIRGDDGARTSAVPVQATAAEPGARATLVRYERGGLLRIERLPVQRRGRVYQVWLLRGKRLEPSSLFAVRKDGSGAAAIPGGLGGVQVVMVSEEPAGGSSKPTTQPVLRASL
jgi:hypothetical protein